MHVTGVLMSKISPARATAFEVLRGVAEGAYASDLLRGRSRSLEARDAALASQIVFGCLRYQAQLDYLIALYSGRRIEALDLCVQLALRAAIFQIRYLERIPAHAAVHESVEYVKRSKRGAAGFVNAVLRKVNRYPVEWPNEETALSCPAWLLDRWGRHFGSASARGIAEAALTEPGAYIRIRPRDELPAGIEAAPTDVAGCWRLMSPARPAIRLHDISSQAIVPLLGLQAGQSYLDLCAAPGNKMLQALETPLLSAVACDVSERRLREVPPVCARVVLDATQRLPFARSFDRIFIDAPCSGTGTLARNPEIKWRVRESDFARFREKQIEIVRQARERLAPGGKLLYATCSLEVEENEEVVREILARCGGLRLEREMWRIPGRDEGDGFYAAVLCLGC
jgi:16S rRNA (cytosine967-C5)-methyltransferase